MATIKIKTTITPSDITGSIKNFPIEVVKKMIEEQVNQGNEADVTVFQEERGADKALKGFNWCNTEDGHLFWQNVIVTRNFDLFFEKYPKIDNKVYIIGDSEIGIDIIKTLENRGGVNKCVHKGSRNNAIYYIDPITNIICFTDIDSPLYNVVATTFKCIKAERHNIVISISEIAKELGVDANQIVVKA
jgi:hypothetical protein